MFEVKVIADSLAPCGRRLTTITATYPRFIHSEILTHRDRERNSASSRAIPFTTMVQRIQNEPVIPLQWLSEQRGMQGGAEIPEALRPLARAIWLTARDEAAGHSHRLHDIERYVLDGAGGWRNYGKYLTPDEIDALVLYSGIPDMPDIKVHKSLPNRIVEPWMWMTVVMTATEWKNFFRLRCHPDAEIHFQKIAGMIRNALDTSQPIKKPASQTINPDGWHLPFILDDDWASIAAICKPGEFVPLHYACRISVARCARVSYLTHEGKRDIEKDLKLFTDLANGSGFGHWSPHGHVAQACSTLERSGPFIGWKQFRKQFPLENEEG